MQLNKPSGYFQVFSGLYNELVEECWQEA